MKRQAKQHETPSKRKPGSGRCRSRHPAHPCRGRAHQRRGNRTLRSACRRQASRSASGGCRKTARSRPIRSGSIRPHSACRCRRGSGYGRCRGNSPRSPRSCRPIGEIVSCDRVTGEDCFIARAQVASVADLEAGDRPDHSLRHDQHGDHPVVAGCAAPARCGGGGRLAQGQLQNWIAMLSCALEPFRRA